jgi:hypothetical protein
MSNKVQNTHVNQEIWDGRAISQNQSTSRAPIPVRAFSFLFIFTKKIITGKLTLEKATGFFFCSKKGKVRSCKGSKGEATYAMPPFLTYCACLGQRDGREGREKEPDSARSASHCFPPSFSSSLCHSKLRLTGSLGGVLCLTQRARKEGGINGAFCRGPKKRKELSFGITCCARLGG